MSSIDLNIIERGLKGQAWTSDQGFLRAGDLDKVMENCTNNSGALNALPTPFARFFVVKEAFRRVLEETKNPQKGAGEAYHRLVSDALDVFELLYNLTFHESRWGDNMKIIVREWNAGADLTRLKATVPILGNTVDSFFHTDLKGAGQKIFFIILENDGREYLLAASSPYTGFVTPPDLDKQPMKPGSPEVCFMGERYLSLPHIARKTGGRYFRDIRLFDARDKDFKNYMFQLLNVPELGADMRELRDYVKQLAVKDNEIVTTWKPNLAPIYSDNASELSVNGLTIGKDAGISTVNFFTDTLIRLPFRLSSNFRGMKYSSDSDSRNYDFIMPLSKDALAKLDGPFECECKVKKFRIEVILKFHGEEYTKEYAEDSDGSGSLGRIVDLKKEGISFNMGVFPDIISPNAAENNFFKIMSVVNASSDMVRPFTVDDVNLKLYVRGNEGGFKEIETITEDNTVANYGVRPALVRSRQDRRQEVEAGTKFYEVFNSKFDAISICFKLNNGECDGVLLPNWRYSQNTCDAYTYAVDLGTTNTYISCSKIGLDYEPEQLRMNSPMVAFLHDAPLSPQHSAAAIIESAMNPKCRKGFVTEFIPSLIDGSIYRFPLRTALCVKKGEHARPALFDNSNIAFFYEKSIGQGNQTILTDIKWEENNDRQLRLFIRELLLIIKADILQKNGQLANTRLIWFRPLSFTGSIRDIYNTIWREEAREILNIGESQIECVSESEAPYYYFNKKNSFNSVDAVSIVDIGGGSSDFIYFSDGKPQIANSIHFGCDVLWGNGFSGFDNDRSNGIFRRYEGTLHLGTQNDELEQLNMRMKRDKTVSTKDIINFWLSHDDRCEFSKKLRTEYKPLFLYHFAAIIYFMARMYQARGLACPRSVLFCGNGSRYIDTLLSSDKNVIKLLVTTVFQKVYGDVKDIQVILPDSRKECTCYGGLYRTSDATVPEEYSYQVTTAKTYKNVGEIKADYERLSQEVRRSIFTLNQIYAELLNLLIGQGEMDRQVDPNNLAGILCAGVEDSLEKNFKTQIAQKLSDSEVYHDSVFFMPVIDNILKLTQI